MKTLYLIILCFYIGRYAVYIHILCLDTLSNFYLFTFSLISHKKYVLWLGVNVVNNNNCNIASYCVRQTEICIWTSLITSGNSSILLMEVQSPLPKSWAKQTDDSIRNTVLRHRHKRVHCALLSGIFFFMQRNT